MQINLIVAMARNRVIGCHGRMPWHLSEDLRRFKKITWGKPLLMGRRTFESIGRPLPGRHNIVVSRSAAFHPSGCSVVHSLEEGLARAQEIGSNHSETELMVIGGATLYAALMPRAQRIYLTLIHADYSGDTYFPEWSIHSWREVAREDRPANPDFPHPYSFILLERTA
ncbi:dihydrofolate reductase [Methylohalobius crimeensis]|uniref:dihydrofolate reductase n=1 Tax=Methylohalobius crimeensis TaxID=244365 RepID=UPI0003B4C939|nr:dihydrofolate reductase [Methylohalobius crimeensis]